MVGQFPFVILSLKRVFEADEIENYNLSRNIVKRCRSGICLPKAKYDSSPVYGRTWVKNNWIAQQVQ